MLIVRTSPNAPEELFSIETVEGHSGQAIGPKLVKQNVLPPDYAKGFYHAGFTNLRRHQSRWSYMDDPNTKWEDKTFVVSISKTTALPIFAIDMHA